MIACWLYKWRFARALDENCELNPKAARHPQSCRACSEWQSRQVGIAARLQSESTVQAEVPAFLHARMVARLGSETRQPEEIGAWLPWAGAIFLATILFLGAIAWHRTGSVPVRTASDSTVVEQTAREDHSLGSLRLPGSGVLAELSRKWDQPLEKEMKSVVQDARAAVNLLAYNFLPETFLASRDSSPVKSP